MTSPDHKMYWDLLETFRWIGARDEGVITAMGDIDEKKWTPLTSFPLDANESGIIGPSQALNYLLQLVRSRRIRMTAIKCDRYRVKQVLVPLAALDDLEFRSTSDHRFTKVGLWSRSHNTLMWRSPQFLRSDIIRVWPARKKKSAAVSAVILLHLQTIMTPAAPLTRAEAQRRCFAEVPDAYPGAFKQAWAILDPSCKRGRGQRDGRTR
jgi:hypothetical protein